MEFSHLEGMKDPDSWDGSNFQFYLKNINNSQNKSILRQQSPVASQISSSNYKTDEIDSDPSFSSASSRNMKLRDRKKNDTEAPIDIFNKNRTGLQKVLKQQKIKAIINTFVTKLRRNNVHGAPKVYQPFQKQQAVGFIYSQGFNIPNWLDLLIAFLSINQILFLFFFYTLALVFVQIINSQQISSVQSFSIGFYFLQILLNFLTIKTINGKKLLTLKDIAINYLKKKFIVDFVCLVILIIDVTADHSLTKYFRLCVIFKIKEVLIKMQKIQNFFITNFYKEQYWELTKVFLINFAFAHILAILLIAMAQLEKQVNWLKKIQIENDPWYEQYAWAYYWGTTTMLTVGFGDLTPANYKQAICLTLIETFSCILLAYNINCVGSLISNIRSQDTQKNKNLKTIRRLAQENNIPDEVQWTICNYINQSDKMRKQFQFETDKQFITSLPTQLRGQYLKQANIKVFKNLGFFQNLTEKTVLGLAQNIQVMIAHPQQIIFRNQDEGNFMILRNGKVGFCAKIKKGNFDNTIIDKIEVQRDQSPRFLHLRFITTLTTNSKYDIKSLQYSMLSSISQQKLMNILKGSVCDYENFCQIRDKSMHIPDQFEILKCNVCAGSHSKMNCPKLHYMPIHQIVIYKQLQSVKKGRCDRKIHLRKNKQNFWKPLERYIKEFRNYQIMIFGEKNFEQITQSQNTYILGGLGNKTNFFPTQNYITQNFSNISQQQIDESAKLKKIEEQKKKMEELFFNKIQEKVVTCVRSVLQEEDNQVFEVDQLHNFNYYFTNNNPHCINFTIKEKKVKVRNKKINLNAETKKINLKNKFKMKKSKQFK